MPDSSVWTWRSNLTWMVSVISYSWVKFWHAHLYFKNILAGYCFGMQAWAWAWPSPRQAQPSAQGWAWVLASLSPLKPGLWAQAGPGTSLPRLYVCYLYNKQAWVSLVHDPWRKRLGDPSPETPPLTADPPTAHLAIHPLLTSQFSIASLKKSSLFPPNSQNLHHCHYWKPQPRGCQWGDKLAVGAVLVVLLLVLLMLVLVGACCK